MYSDGCTSPSGSVDTGFVDADEAEVDMPMLSPQVTLNFDVEDAAEEVQ